jgi:hypothetical protein
VGWPIGKTDDTSYKRHSDFPNHMENKSGESPPVRSTHDIHTLNDELRTVNPEMRSSDVVCKTFTLEVIPSPLTTEKKGLAAMRSAETSMSELSKLSVGIVHFPSKPHLPLTYTTTIEAPKCFQQLSPRNNLEVLRRTSFCDMLLLQKSKLQYHASVNFDSCIDQENSQQQSGTI